MKFGKGLILIAILSLFMIVIGSGSGMPRVTGAALATGIIGSGFTAVLVLVATIDWILR
jgi:hypothetical protein